MSPAEYAAAVVNEAKRVVAMALHPASGDDCPPHGIPRPPTADDRPAGVGAPGLRVVAQTGEPTEALYVCPSCDNRMTAHRAAELVCHRDHGRHNGRKIGPRRMVRQP